MTLTEKRGSATPKPSPRPQLIWDTEISGLGIRITPSGTKSYVLNYRADGKERRYTLGRCSDMSLRAAREQARAELAKIRSGEPDPLRRRQEADTSSTVDDLVRQFFEIEAPARIERNRMKAGTVEVYEYQAKEAHPPRHREAARRRRATRRCRKDGRAPPRSHPQRRVGAGVQAVLACERWELRPPGTNPARYVERARVEARDRILSPSEIAALAQAPRPPYNPQPGQRRRHPLRRNDRPAHWRGS